MNTTYALRYDPPFYFSQRASLIEALPDHLLTLAVPIITYWSYSLFFHLLDISGWKWLDKYRIHESEEIKKKNLVGRGQVIVAVAFQQVIQTLMGLVWIEEDNIGSGNVASAARLARAVKGLQKWERFLEPVIDFVVGRVGVGGGEKGAGLYFLGMAVGKEELLAMAAYFTYWWAIPILQFGFAMFVMDTWQYFLHRSMHINKFLYKSVHSWHHRLYVPYAFGSLYNHPVEGFLLDTLGAAISESAAGLTTRQAMLFFIVSTCKTVDDHCGYNLPFDPLQIFSSNNADYHDIHHQVVGIKSNFAQPFFVHWDTILGTKMTREEMEQRKKNRSLKKE